MKTALITHADTQGHVGLAGYQENPDRLIAIANALSGKSFDGLIRESAPKAKREDLLRVHPAGFVDFMLQEVPVDGDFVHIDYDTALSPGTANAALRAAGAATHALDGIVTGEYENAFCAVRPPGHHARPDQAMGFCFFSNIAIAAMRARQVHGIKKIAVVDFDVHHGNGTQDALQNVGDMYFGSIHQHPHYPHTGVEINNEGPATLRNIPMAGGTHIDDWWAAYETKIINDLEKFKPELVLVSAGFDAHKADPLGEFNLDDDDYFKLGKQLKALAKAHSNGRLLAILEGGYDLDALARSTAAFVEAIQ